MTGSRITMSDVASATGLSRATIDRVLNGRPGVKAETQQKVKKALKELKYSQDAINAGQFRDAARLQLILPKGSNPFFKQLRSGFDHTLKSYARANLKTVCYAMDPYSPKTILERLKSVSPLCDAVVTVGVDLPEVEDAINELVAKGVRVVTVISDVPGSKRAAFIGQNNFVAGRTAGRLMLNMLPPEPCSVAVLVGHLHFRHLLDRQAGFQQAIGLERPEVLVLPAGPYGADPQVATSMIANLRAVASNLKGIYIAGGGQPYLMDEISKMITPYPIMIGHEATRVTQTQLRQNTFKFVLAHDVRVVAHKAIQSALGHDFDVNQCCGIRIYVKENFPEIY